MSIARSEFGKPERKVKGLLGTKLGMTQLWDENNRVVPVTVIQAGPCVVTQVRTPDSDGYAAVQLGFGAIKAKQVTEKSRWVLIDVLVKNQDGDKVATGEAMVEFPTAVA